jgi:septum formation topological specificity factor MinE
MSDLAPWEMDSIISTWNEHGAKALGFRVYTDGKAGSRPRSARRLAVILSKHRTNLQELEANLLVALVYMQQQGLERIKQVTGSEINARLTFWRFIDPPDNLRALADAALGRTPAVIAEQQAWRDQKRQMLDEFKAEVSDFIEQAVRLSGSDLEKLHRALHEARTGLANAEDALSD